MTRRDIKTTSIRTLCEVLEDEYFAIREELCNRLKAIFIGLKIKEVEIKPMKLKFSDCGFSIWVDKVYIRDSDDSIMCSGRTDFTNKPNESFLSYLRSEPRKIVELYEEIIKNINKN
jgi:hypothetical protein